MAKAAVDQVEGAALVDDVVGQGGPGAARQPRGEAPPLDPAVGHAVATEADGGEVDRFLAAIGEQADRLAAGVAQRPDDVRGVLDVEVDEAALVEPQDEAPIGLLVEPAPQGGAQAGVADLLALVDEAPGGVEGDAGAAEALELGGGQVPGSGRARPRAAARAGAGC